MAHLLASAAALLAAAPTPTAAPQGWDGPVRGLPLPDLQNRRCGDGHNGANDTTSPMCDGSTSDGRLAIPLPEMERRCGADSKGYLPSGRAVRCHAFARYSGAGQAYFRPVFEISSIDATKGGWELWTARGYKPGPVPPTPAPSPPTPNPPPSPSPTPAPPPDAP